jgi:hypothetical protein
MVAPLLWAALAGALLMAFLVAALIVFTPRMPIRYRLERRMTPCPADGRMAEVEFVMRADDGDVAIDVLRCSHRPGDVPVTCGRECRSASVAPFARRQAVG